MTWFGYIVAGLFSLNMVLNVADDKKSGGHRLFSVVIGAGLLAGILAVGTGSL